MHSLFNSHLNTVDIWISFINIALFIRAGYWNLKAARTHILAPTRMVVVFFSVVYVFAYMLLTFTEISVGTWGTIFRGVGGLVIWNIWGNQARDGLKTQGDISRAVSVAVEKELARRFTP